MAEKPLWVISARRHASARADGRVDRVSPAVVESRHYSESAHQLRGNSTKNNKTRNEFEWHLEVLNYSWDDLTQASWDVGRYRVYSDGLRGKTHNGMCNSIVRLLSAVFLVFCVAVNPECIYILISNPIKISQGVGSPCLFHCQTLRPMSYATVLDDTCSHKCSIAFSQWNEKKYGFMCPSDGAGSISGQNVVPQGPKWTLVCVCVWSIFAEIWYGLGTCLFCVEYHNQGNTQGYNGSDECVP